MMVAGRAAPAPTHRADLPTGTSTDERLLSVSNHRTIAGRSGARPTAVRWATAASICLILALGGLLLLGAAARAQDTGWTIERFHADITIHPDASITVAEAIDVDFGGLEQHGIFREIPVEYTWNDDYNRVYRLDVLSVTDAGGAPVPYTREEHGVNVRIRIGDPDETVSGRQTYRITYRVEGALNAFADHDELYWNVNGAEWQVPTRETSATVRLENGGLQRATCFQGDEGDDTPCDLRLTDTEAEYRATVPLQPGQQLTIVAGIRKGAIAEPVPILERRPRDPSRWFERANPLTLGGTAVLLIGGLALLATNWWTRGRDRRYTSLYYLTENPEEETRPLLQGDPVVVEFQPPEKLRPAQIGLLLDERADTKDVTATIVDLAVHGYLTITEIPKEGLFGKKDWELKRTGKDDTGLEEYERLVLAGLFEDGSEVKLSDLKNEFYKDLAKAQKALYADAVQRRWFNGNPQFIRNLWLGIGIGVLVLGGLLVAALGYFFGAGMLGLPVAIVGLLILVTAHAMPRRTALGSELLRRSLGFRRYITTAETDRQRFNEQANIFAEYLPYAIVFGAVDKWARAFRDIDTTATTAGWYYGAAGFNAVAFSRDLESFNSSVSSTIASTPGGSGGSGFSGGGAGGGGGGGGGGSW
jgi:uncharacterized membrane protein